MTRLQHQGIKLRFHIRGMRHADTAKLEQHVYRRERFHMSRCGIRFVMRLRIDADTVNWIAPCSDSQGNFFLNEGVIQNMTSGAGVSRTIWRDFRFSGQPEVLIEFLPMKLYFPVQIMVCYLLKSVPIYFMHTPPVFSLFFMCFFNCINLYAIAVNSKLFPTEKAAIWTDQPCSWHEIFGIFLNKHSKDVKQDIALIIIIIL